jgi:hypothetical protein
MSWLAEGPSPEASDTAPEKVVAEAAAGRANATTSVAASNAINPCRTAPARESTPLFYRKGEVRKPPDLSSRR